MKLVIDEKLKHRLVGLCVILSLGAIFLPALMKKSSQRLESHFSVNVKLPPKPAVPKVAITAEKEMFQTIKVAQIKTPDVTELKGTNLGKAGFIQSVQVADDTAVTAAKSVSKIVPVAEAIAVAKPIELALSNATKNAIKKQVKVVDNKLVQSVVVKNVKPINKLNVAKKSATVPLNKKDVYAVQLASFAKLSNAQALVNKLHNQGYKANYIKTTARKGFVYKVFTGYSPVKGDVVKLRSQLASAMQLNGFVINTRTGVS